MSDDIYQEMAQSIIDGEPDQAKELAMRQTGLVQLTVANLPATEAYGTIAGAPPSYRRTTTIFPTPGGVPGARVDVIVFYRPVTGRGVLTTERSVSLTIFLANR